MSNDSFAGMSDEDFEAHLNNPPAMEVEVPSEPPATPAEEEPAPTELEPTPELGEPQPDEVVPVPVEGDPLEALYKPLEINGTELEIQSVDEARKLMAMGVQNQKFVKENRRTIDTLNEHKIGEAELNHLIDVMKGNPEAIAQFVKQHNIDVVDLEEKKEAEYKPTNHMVSQATVTLNEVLDEIQATPTFEKTTNIVTKEWDAVSKQSVLANPGFLKELNDHVRDGTYEKVMKEVNRTRVFGGMAGMTDLQAYAAMGKQMQESGALTPAPAPVVTRQPKQVDAKTVDKKRSASPSPTTQTPPAPEEVDFRGMGDDVFEKYLRGN